jgi:hypothetical protein
MPGTLLVMVAVQDDKHIATCDVLVSEIELKLAADPHAMRARFLVDAFDIAHQKLLDEETNG